MDNSNAVISKLMQAFYKINTSSTIYKSRLRIFNQFFDGKDFVRINLPKWIETPHVDQSTRAQFGKMFVKQYIEYCSPEFMQFILPLAEKVAPLLENRKESEEFLMVAWRKTLAPQNPGI